MRKLLRRYNQIYDFIIFGSAVKGRLTPRDIDIAVITASKDPAQTGELKTAIDKEIKNAHVQLICYEDFIKSKYPYYALFEGYSVKEYKFLPEKFHIRRKVLYTFNLDGLIQTKKVMFNKALRFIIKNTGSEKTGKGSVLVPIKSTAEFNDFFSHWKRKIRKKELIEI